MAYKTADELVDEFEKDWNAACNPCVSCLIARCHPDYEDELRDRLDHLLMTLPTPPYSPVQMRRGMERVKPIADRVIADLDFTLAGDDDPVRMAYLAKPWHYRWPRDVKYRLTKLKWRMFDPIVWRFKKKAWE